MIPAGTSVPSNKVLYYRKDENRESRAIALDELEEVRVIANIRLAAYKKCMAKYFNRQLKHPSFVVGDLVLRTVANDLLNRSHGKLHPNWADPYRVTKVIPGGAYKLETLGGRQLHNTWNITSLRYLERMVNKITI